ncbi:MAG: hypothetical protein AAGF83_23270 [Cyanobacteria bacterium P01_G01_bin.67]
MYQLSRIVPEAITLFIIVNSTELRVLPYICCLWLSYSIILRFVWHSAIIIHGLGHSMLIALADRQLSTINFTNILEQQSVGAIFKSLVPCNQIFIPILAPHLPCSPTPNLAAGNSQYIRIKSLGGIIFNLAIAIIFWYHPHNFFSQAIIAANLIIALTSISDLEAAITGIAQCFYCGNFGLIAERKPEDGDLLLPKRMVDISQKMGQETEVRGEQAGGGLVIGRNGKHTIFVGKKIVNRKRDNLTKSLEAAFAPIRAKAIAAGVKPLKSMIIGAWHYRYATSGSAPSELETHWHEWMTARSQKVWQFTGTEWKCTSKNVHHRITHNGDFDSWNIFNKDVDYPTLGLWLERVLHTPNSTKGDSPKIAGMMDLLVTQGMWYPSVRLAYQQAIATSIAAAFDGQQPTRDAPHTAPSQQDLNTWAEIFEGIFADEIFPLKHSDPSKLASDFLKSSTSLQQSLLQALENHGSTANWTKAQRTGFTQFTLQAFLSNDLYRATQIFISQAKGSFGLVTTSTLKETELILCAQGQPITVGFNWEQGYMVYASEPAAVDRILLNKAQSFRLDLDQKNGEVAKVSARDITIYSLVQQQELTVIHLKDRWISMVNHPYLSQIKLSDTAEQDPVEVDLQSIPQILHEIKISWENPTSLNRRSADYLIYLLTEKVQRFENRQQRMFKAGLISRIRKMPSVDLLITGEENSLWLGEKFAQDLRVVFPLLNIATMPANEVLQQLDQSFAELNLSKDSLVMAITQSGQTFSTVQVINIFDHLSSQGIIGELFIFTGEISSFINSTQGKGGLTTVSHSNFLDKNNSHRSRIFVNGSGRRTAEPSTVTVAAAGQTLTELLLYIARQMRNDFPRSHPLGMTLTAESLRVLAMMKEDFLNKNLLQIIGTNSKGESHNSNIKKDLFNSSRHWANHVTETPLAWAIHALYTFISVGWAIPFGHTIPIVKTLSALIFKLVNLPTAVTDFLGPVINIADIAVYIFGAWLWTLAIRYFQGRQLFARTGNRTLVIGDVPWVNQLLEAYVSKLFSLSYGIASIEVHSANPQNHLLHAYGHRVVRGTLIWLGIPDGRRSKQQQAAENAVIMTGKQANGIKNFNIGAEIIAVGHNPKIANQGFSKSLLLDSNNDQIYFRNDAVAEQQEQIEQLRESCFGSFERLIASYVFFWALAKKVADFPFLKYEYWKSQSRTKVMTTAAPVPGMDLKKLPNARSHYRSTIKDYSPKK